MAEFTAILTILVMFLVRIGIPLVLLITLGTLIERHQRNREEHIEAMYQKVTPFQPEEGKATTDRAA
jgi:hypothetical protein